MDRTIRRIVFPSVVIHLRAHVEKKKRGKHPEEVCNILNECSLHNDIQTHAKSPLLFCVFPRERYYSRRARMHFLRHSN